MFKEIVATALLSSFVGIKPLQPKKATGYPYYNNVSSAYYQGVYNFRDSFDTWSLLSFFDENNITYIEKTFQLDLIPVGGGQPWAGNTYPIGIDDTGYFISDIIFGYDEHEEISVQFDVYYALNLQDSYYFVIDDFTSQYVSLTTLPNVAHDIIFNLRQGVVFNDYCNCIFDFFFTREDNSYVTTYNGYYTATGVSSTSVPFCAFGSELSNGRMGIDLICNPNDNTWDEFVYYYYTYRTDYYYYYTDSFPLDMVGFERSFLVNWKLSNSSYAALQQVGTFNYIRDTSFDNATFKDLFFGIADTPVYFATSLLSFELFGINIFTALTGLLTLILILTLIKKFW